MNPYYYVKICGLTNIADAEMAVNLGSDFLGMVFHPASKRVCSVAEARAIKSSFAAKPRVLVFGHDKHDYILEIYKQLRDMLTFIQVPFDHPEFSRLEDTFSPGRIIPAIAMRRRLEDEELHRLRVHPVLVLDTPSDDIPGGTGRTFSWELTEGIEHPYLLAGGLKPENICAALEQVDPFGVDVASGTEAEPGKKDPQKMRDFFLKVRARAEHCD